MDPKTMADEACCQAPRPAEKTDLQCALDELVDAERERAQVDEAYRMADRAVDAALMARGQVYMLIECAAKRVCRARRAVHAASMKP